MKIVIDTNVLFSFFLASSITRNLILTTNFELISPQLALEEIEKYSEEIKRKARLDRTEFQRSLVELKSLVTFLDRRDYSSLLEEANKISPDKADAEFFALCLKFDCFLWSNDSILKSQDRVRVLSTEDIIKIIL